MSTPKVRRFRSGQHPDGPTLSEALERFKQPTLSEALGAFKASMPTLRQSLTLPDTFKSPMSALSEAMERISPAPSDVFAALKARVLPPSPLAQLQSTWAQEEVKMPPLPPLDMKNVTLPAAWLAPQQVLVKVEVVHVQAPPAEAAEAPRRSRSHRTPADVPPTRPAPKPPTKAPSKPTMSLKQRRVWLQTKPGVVLRQKGDLPETAFVRALEQLAKKEEQQVVLYGKKGGRALPCVRDAIRRAKRAWRKA